MSYDYEDKIVFGVQLYRVYDSKNRLDTVALCESLDKATRVIDTMNFRDSFNDEVEDIEEPSDIIQALFEPN